MDAPKITLTTWSNFANSSAKIWAGKRRADTPGDTWCDVTRLDTAKINTYFQIACTCNMNPTSFPIPESRFLFANPFHVSLADVGTFLTSLAGAGGFMTALVQGPQSTPRRTTALEPEDLRTAQTTRGRRRVPLTEAHTQTCPQTPALGPTAGPRGLEAPWTRGELQALLLPFRGVRRDGLQRMNTCGPCQGFSPQQGSPPGHRGVDPAPAGKTVPAPAPRPPRTCLTPGCGERAQPGRCGARGPDGETEGSRRGVSQRVASRLL